MNILIVGCGRVGRELVTELTRLGHDVSVLDESRENLRLLREHAAVPLDGVMMLEGVPIDVDVLKSAGIESCDTVAAVTPDNNINIMVAQMAETVFHIKNVITRISDPSRKNVFCRQFGLRAVCDTTLTAQSMLASILNEESDEKQFVTFGSSTADFYAQPAAEALVGKPLSAVTPPREGMMVYGVLRASGVLELAVQPAPIIHREDKIVFSVITG